MARQPRHAINGAVAGVYLVRDFVDHHVESRLRSAQVGKHVGPGKHHRALLPGLARQFVVPFMGHSVFIQLVPANAKLAGIDNQLAPALQPVETQMQHRKAGHAGKQGRA